MRKSFRQKPPFFFKNIYNAASQRDGGGVERADHGNMSIGLQFDVDWFLSLSVPHDVLNYFEYFDSVLMERTLQVE